MPKVLVNNVEIHYDEFGEGEETLAFSHGFLMNNTMFKGQIDTFKANFRCIAFDHRGHGQSEVTTNGYELDNLVTDAIGLIETLNLGAVHFIGMSTGGFVGMRIAIKRPELLKSLILIDTSAEEEPKESMKKNRILLWIVKHIGWFPVIEQVMAILFHKSFLKDKSQEAEVKRWRNIIINQDKKAMIPFCKAILDRENVLHKLASVTVPTAIIVGENDEPTPPQYNKRMAETIPKSYYFTIPDAGHSAAIEKPEDVANAMAEFYSNIGLL